MAIRPIDIALNIQHAPDMARLGTTDTQGRPEVAAQQFAERLEKQVRQHEQQVQRQAQAEKPGVNPDQKGDGSGYTARKKKPVQKKEAEKSKVKHPDTHGENMYNILV